MRNSKWRMRRMSESGCDEKRVRYDKPRNSFLPTHGHPQIFTPSRVPGRNTVHPSQLQLFPPSLFPISVSYRRWVLTTLKGVRFRIERQPSGSLVGTRLKSVL